MAKPQQPGNNNQNNQPNNSALTITPRSGELTGFTYTLTTGILSTPVSRNIRDQSNLSVGQIKLPTFAASEHKGGLLIFNNINGKEDLSYNSFQVSDNSYRYIQFGNFNFDQNDERLFFARGNETTQMPGGGSATYSGDSILNFHNKDEQYLRTETGTMSARADFAKGTLDLSVKTPSHSGSITGAHINDNGFIGVGQDKTTIGGGTSVTHSITESGKHLAGIFPMSSYKEWARNAVHIHRLNETGKRIKQLEQELAELKNGKQAV